MGGEACDEWVLMYSKGLTQAQIADLCRADQSTVTRAIGWAKRRDPDLQSEHNSFHPEYEKPSLPTRQFLERVAELKDFIDAHGRAPFTKGGAPEEWQLGVWLAKQRKAAREGRLLPERRRALDAAGNWQDHGRAQRDERNWQDNLVCLAAFTAATGRFPSYRRPDDDFERRLGTWLHSQRQLEAEGRLPGDRSASLTAQVPGWYTWRKRS